MIVDLEVRLAALMLERATFTADDVTDSGRFTIDPAHAPNGAQSAIGSMFRRLSNRRLIVFTGDTTRSSAPHRKGGLIRVWTATPEGREWARARKVAP